MIYIMTGFLIRAYKKKKNKIKKRLQEFKCIWQRPEKKIFSELCFCICTPQSKAIYCNKAITDLEKNNLLYTGSLGRLKSELKGVRFPNNKARYILKARKLFNVNSRIKIKNRINVCNISLTRDWFVKNVKGIGLKEASHFLRNIGFGKDIAILDVHILRNLKKFKVIKNIPASISRTVYFDIENKMKAFSKKINIPLQELDLLLWSNQTGFIFK